MKLTTRGRYAVTAMLDLALHTDDKPCSLGTVASRQDLSRDYLEQLFAQLRRGGLLKSTRGTEGGYRLSKPAADISVADILSVVDKPIDVTRCGGRGDCQGGSTCLTHHLWDELGDHIRSFLEGISLEELGSRSEIMQVYHRQTSTHECVASTRLSAT